MTLRLKSCPDEERRFSPSHRLMKALSKSNPAQESGVAVFQSPSLAEIPWLVHGFSTRRGGVSSLANSPGALRQGGNLNLGKLPWDHPRKVEQNRRRLLASLKA